MSRLTRTLLFSVCLILTPGMASAYDVPPQATVNQNYSGLLQIVHCPQDQSQYGSFNDYGYYGATSWCGVQTPAGYWVWVAPNWYIWQNSRAQGAATEYNSRYGSGSNDGQGNWNHYSKPPGSSTGMGVGGTSDGCIYTTTGWSNC